MIKAVQDWFENELISAKHRAHFDQNYEHKLTIKLEFIKTLMLDTFAAEFEKVDPNWKTVILPNGKNLVTVLTDSVYDEVDDYYRLQTVKNRVYQEQSKTDYLGNTQDIGVRVNGTSGKFIIKGEQPGGKGNDIILEFGVGIIMKRTGRAQKQKIGIDPKTGKARYSTTKVILMAALRNMFGICAGNVYKGDIKTQLDKAVAHVRNQMKKTHGETMDDDEGVYQADPNEFAGSKSPATVAILSLAKDWSSIYSKAKAKGIRTSGGILVDDKVLDETIKEITGALEIEYGITDFLDAKGQVRRDILITMELNGPQGAMRKYDVDGIKAFLKSVREDVLNNLLKNKKISHIAHLEGSDSPVTLMKREAKKAVIVDMLGAMKKANPDLRLKVNKQLLADANKAKKGVKRTNKVKGKIGKSSKTRNKSSKANKPRKRNYKAGQRSIATAQTQVSPIALRNILNEALPMQVAKNMGSPALNYRTGRFANSVRVEHAARGQRGGLHIDYTYMRDPYETFEPGNKQGSTYRNPKKLIGDSIRELAIGIIGKQPHTIRRV